MALLWNDPDPSFEIMANSSERIQIPELTTTPTRTTPSGHLFEVAPPHETASYWRTPPRAFSKFAKLNSEIRQIIWDFAIADDARVIEMRHSDLQIFLEDESQITGPESLIKPRALLSVCTESRNHLLKSLRLVDLGTCEFYLVNFEVDTIYFGPDSYWFHEVRWRPDARDAQQQADYNSRDVLKQGWQKTGEWNHWRQGHEKGEKGVCDAYQNRYQTRHFTDNYHPLLSSPVYEDERRQIMNVAFDLEFWEETYKRRCGGQLELIFRFSNAKTFVLGAGDIGSAYNVTREDKGAIHGREESYSPKLTTQKTTKHSGVVYKGQVDFLSGAVQTPLKEEIIEFSKNSSYPTIMTMCVTRGGKFSGHESRFIATPPLSQQQQPDEHDAESDTLYDEEETLSDDDANPCDIRRIPGLREMLGLHDDQDHMTEEDLQYIERIISDYSGHSADFHRQAAVPVDVDEDADDEMMELDEDGDGEADDVVRAIEAESVADTVFVDDNEGSAREISAKTRTDFTVAIAADGIKKPRRISTSGKIRKAPSPRESNSLEKINSVGKIRKAPSSRKPTPRGRPTTPKKKNRHLTTADQGDNVAEIIESKVHYSKLTYRVRFKDQPEPDKNRYARTEPMFIDNEYCKALVIAWHAANLNADDIQAEADYERKAYGTVTKNGQRIIGQAPTLPRTPPTGASPSKSPLEQSRMTTPSLSPIHQIGCSRNH